jgi:hypothetical protein
MLVGNERYWQAYADDEDKDPNQNYLELNGVETNFTYRDHHQVHDYTCC